MKNHLSKSDCNRFETFVLFISDFILIILFIFITKKKESRLYERKLFYQNRIDSRTRQWNSGECNAQNLDLTVPRQNILLIIFNLCKPFNLPPSVLQKREVIYIDIANDPIPIAVNKN